MYYYSLQIKVGLKKKKVRLGAGADQIGNIASPIVASVTEVPCLLNCRLVISAYVSMMKHRFLYCCVRYRGTVLTELLASNKRICHSMMKHRFSYRCDRYRGNVLTELLTSNTRICRSMMIHRLPYCCALYRGNVLTELLTSNKRVCRSMMKQA
jgi:hypothetical protein